MITATPTRDDSGELVSLTLVISGESLGELVNILNRALNIETGIPPDWRELADIMVKVLKIHRFNQTPTKNPPKPGKYSGVPLEDIPICKECGGLGERHYHNCPELQKK